MTTNKKVKKKVLLALSGGVDSAITAMLLKKQNYEVIAAFMKNFSDTKNKLTGECHWVEDYKMAQTIAAQLKIPLIKLDLEREYKKYVIEPMFSSYKQGITPNPDIACNTIIKFPLLWKTARAHGIDYLATGHYARIKKIKRGYELLQARDKTKDQSYFLHELNQDDLSHTIFPIGDFTKTEVRKIAQNNKLPNCNRQSSRGVCFIGNIPLKRFLEQRIKKRQGKVCMPTGEIIGTHRGAHYYTIGERVRPTIGIKIEKGVYAQERFFVAEKNMKENIITVAPTNHPLLKKSSFKLKNVHWVNEKDKKSPLKATVRIRHLGKCTPAILTLKNKQWCVVTTPLEGVAPGQAAVFYIGNKLVCGGAIAS